MNTVISEPGRTSLDEQIDEAEQLILEGELGPAADRLEEVRLEARREKDVASLRRIASIAGSARELRWRYRIKFDSLKVVTEASIRIIEGPSRPRVASRGDGPPVKKPSRTPEPSGAGDLVAAIGLHMAAILFVVILIFMAIATEAWSKYSEEAVLAGLVAWESWAGLTWLLSLGVIVGRWLMARPPLGEMAAITVIWGLIAVFLGLAPALIVMEAFS